MNLITSEDNPNIKLYKKLVSGAKYRKENGMFAIEGARIVSDALSENADMRFVFATESFVAKNDRYFAGRDFRGKIFLISDKLENRLSDTKTPQGIYAACGIPDNPAAVFPGGKYLFICGLQDPGNMGTIIRTADALGLAGLFISGCCDIYSPKTARSAMGSVLRLRITEISCEKAFGLFSENGIKTYAAVSDKTAAPLTEADFDGGCAVFIGNEGNGLQEEIIKMCGSKITIKMKGAAESLNAAVAAGIIMWEMRGA